MCAKNEENFSYRVHDKICQVPPSHFESFYLGENTILETIGSSFAIVLIISHYEAKNLGLDKLIPALQEDKVKGKISHQSDYLIKKISNTLIVEDSYHHLLCSAQIFKILYNHLTDNSSDLRPDLKCHYERVQLAKSIIHQDMSKRITIPELAKIVGTNEQYLKKYFKTYLGKTIANYTTEIKMEYARSLLASGNLLISDVSRMTGYKHATHFTTTFKKYHGYKPTEFK